MNKEYDVDAIVQDVENAVLAGKYRLASEEEKMLVRIGALEREFSFRDTAFRHGLEDTP